MNYVAETPEEKERRLSSWTCNVIDEFKPLSQEEIKSKLKERQQPFAVCVENVYGDFNISTALRNANGFGAMEFCYVGRKRFDRRGAVGTWHYTDVNHFDTIDDFIKLKSKYKFIGVDNVPGAIPVSEHVWEPDTMLIFGSEGVGLTKEMRDICDEIVYVPMFGTVRSFNVGTTSGIIMFDFVNRIGGVK
jgi:tRNA G18 (ribose-2'-O)-methylase SpoU